MPGLFRHRAGHFSARRLDLEGASVGQMTHAVATSLTKLAESTRFAVQIGGFSIGLWCTSDIAVAADPELAPFLLHSVPTPACDIELDVCWAEDLKVPGSAPAFRSGGLWSAYLHTTGTQFYLCSSAVGSQPYKAAWFDPTFSRGHLVLNRSTFAAGSRIYPLEYPLDELAMMHRLALGEGIEVHALGLADEDGSGYLFLGHSGAGKSTTARLWKEQRGVRLLSDDRIILREQYGKILMYGTPWHGDAGVASAESAPLSAIFLLEQSPVHELRPISQTKAAAELFARAFVPHYLKSGIQFSLEFVDQVTRAVPSSVFRFAPTPDAVEVIRHARV